MSQTTFDPIISSFGEPPSSRQNAPQWLKLYKPNPDMAFDIEMGRRASRNSGDTATDPINLDHDDPLRINKQPESATHFGGSAEHQFDHETLRRLDIPPPIQYYPGLQRELRPSAIFIYNRSIALLKTDQIIGHVIGLLRGTELTFQHLEWVDDFSCVLAFNSTPTCIQAFTNFLLHPDEVEGENGIPEAINFLSSDDYPSEIHAAAAEFLLTLRPAKPFANSLFDGQTKNKLLLPTHPEQMIPFVRFATVYDMKELGSRDRSLFYTINGFQAGKDGVQTVNSRFHHPSSLETSSKRKRSSLPYGKAPAGRWGHEELPDFLAPSPGSRRSIKSLKARQPRTKISQMKLITPASLDAELDRFMNKPLRSALEVLATSAGDKPNEKSEDEAGRAPKRQLSSRIGVELFTDKAEIGGGNLRDETFEETSRPESGVEAVLSWPTQETTENKESTEIPEPETREVLGEDEELVEDMVEVIDEETGKKTKRISYTQRPKLKSSSTLNRWGPLFRRLFK
ncbi:hypothetical protein O181_032999 [Austropuccinia psidii MF-1]|uniref:Uncharacterized protein n=1 Tax=Austropuccinia psidii MF-1 TaxID=1389203 RepID=A0A9Q3H836_9BASI|nr:hypothetical protein [Austropuccinia psidii MF-1]